MGLWDDIASGVSGAVQGIAAATPAVLQYINQAQQAKQAKKLAKTMMPMGGFATLGTGNMSFTGGGGMGYQYPVPIGPQQPGGALPFGIDPESYLGQAIQSVTPQTMTPGGLPARGRGSSIIQGPDGRIYRSIGRPLLWSGDLATFRRVKKLAGKLRAYAGHRSFR